MEILDACTAADGSVTLGRTYDGRLWRRDGGWKLYDFNEIHRGFYPACRFTALAYAGDMFQMAGLDGEGCPHVFSSLLGNAWEERNLTARSVMGQQRRASGQVLRILFDEQSHQTFLVCRNGEVVTLPDCPKCVKIKILELGGAAVSDGFLEGDGIVLHLTDGRRLRVPVFQAVQFRISLSYCAEIQKQGAILADLRTPEEFARGHLPGSISLQPEEVEDFLQGREKNQRIAFICRVGTAADDAARCARRMGFPYAYSLGGVNPYAHVE